MILCSTGLGCCRNGYCNWCFCGQVLSMKEEHHATVYLVHYTGWNTRYDEWIKRTRIADNLSWSPGRAKRSRQLTKQVMSSPLI